MSARVHRLPEAAPDGPLRCGSPLREGDRVRVTAPIVAPSGRLIRRGGYEVLRVYPRGGVAVRWRPDCSRLGGRFDEPGALARHPTAALLYGGEYTAYRDDQAETVRDHPLQND